MSDIFASHPYRGFVQEGKQWVGQGSVFIMQGDTSINNIVYKKVSKSYYDFGTKWAYYGAIREQDRCVSLLHNGSSEEVILYDFKMIYDDNCTFETPRDKYVIETATSRGDNYQFCHIKKTFPSVEVVIQGQRRWLYYIEATNGKEGYETYWFYRGVVMEGVGTETGAMCVPDYYGDMATTCYEYGELIANSEDFYLYDKNTRVKLGAEVDPADVTCDDLVDVSDLGAVVNATLGIDDGWTEYADVNNDGSLDVSDVNAVVNAILK